MERITHDIIQCSPEWEAMLLSTNGASEAAAMMGVSPYLSRDDLLFYKATLTAQEFSEFVKSRILEKGHEIEEMTCPIVEEMIGHQLFPMVFTKGNLRASVDGISMDEKTVWECKQYNKDDFDLVLDRYLPEKHIPQCQQILLVTEAKQLFFTISDGTKDGIAGIWVYPDKEYQSRITAGWQQFDIDKANYQPKFVANRPEPQAVIDLPALFVQAQGSVVASNMEQFGKALSVRLEEVRNIALITDQDFSNAKEAAKKFREKIKELESVKNAMLDQTISIGEAKRMIEFWQEDLRKTALQLEKDVERQDKIIKSEMISEARKEFSDYCSEIEAVIRPLRLTIKHPDYAAAIKGKSKYSSMQEAINSTVANAKVEAKLLMESIDRRKDWFYTNYSEHDFLFPDLQTIIYHSDEDVFKLIVESRVAKHLEKEKAKAEEAKAILISAQPEDADESSGKEDQYELLFIDPEINCYLESNEYDYFHGVIKNRARDILIDFVKYQRSKGTHEIGKLKKALSELMPFVLEDYYPDCATEPFKKAVEQAISALGNNYVRREEQTS